MKKKVETINANKTDEKIKPVLDTKKTDKKNKPVVETKKKDEKKSKKTRSLLSFFMWIVLFIGFSLGIFFVFLHIDFQKLPFIGKRIETFSKTKARIIQTEDILVLKTTSFTIDFLLRIETEDGYYLAMYPYEVVLGIDTEQIEFRPNDQNESEVFCRLPAPKILSAEIADTDSILEIKNSLKTDGFSYNTIISPIKKAFEQKAIDEALQNDYFIHTFLENIKNALVELHTETLVFENIDEIKSEMKNAFIQVESPHLPAELVLHKAFLESFTHEDSDTDNNTIKTSTPFMRDDIRIDALRFGLIKDFAKLPSMSYTSFKNKNLLKQKNTLITSWVNPLDMPTQKSFLIAHENGYEKAISVFQDGTISYLDTIEMQNDEQKYFYSLAYLALSTKYKALNQNKKNIFQEYTQFIALYDKALQYLQEEKYTSLELALRQLQNFDFNETETIQLLESIYDAAVLYKYSPVTISNHENFNALLFLQANLFNLEHFNSKENRKNTIFELEKIARETNENFNIQSLKALFLKNKSRLNLDRDEVKEYENDIIESGLLISKELFSSLDAEGRTKYLMNIFVEVAKNKTESIYFEEINHTDFVLLGDSYDILFDKKIKKLFDIQNRLENKLNRKPSFVVLFPEKKTFTTQYHCLVFENDRLLFLENISGIFNTKQVQQFLYENIALSSKAFRLGAKTFENEIILSILHRIHKAYLFDQIYHIELDKNIRSQLVKEVKEKMDRPSY